MLNEPLNQKLIVFIFMMDFKLLISSGPHLNHSFLISKGVLLLLDVAAESSKT